MCEKFEKETKKKKKRKKKKNTRKHITKQNQLQPTYHGNKQVQICSKFRPIPLLHFLPEMKGEISWTKRILCNTKKNAHTHTHTHTHTHAHKQPIINQTFERSTLAAFANSVANCEVLQTTGDASMVSSTVILSWFSASMRDILCLRDFGLSCRFCCSCSFCCCS